MLVIDLRPALVADLPARVGGRMTEASDLTMRDASARHTKRAERNVIMVAVVYVYDVLPADSDSDAANAFQYVMRHLESTKNYGCALPSALAITVKQDGRGTYEERGP